MAKKHQYKVSNKKTRSKANRNWRRKNSEALRQIAKGDKMKPLKISKKRFIRKETKRKPTMISFGDLLSEEDREKLERLFKDG